MMRRKSGLLAAILATLSCIAIAAVAQTPVRPLQENSVYQQWLDEDVAYIATPQERADYLQLTDNKDRDKFIVQFWLRRDPTPGTPENEFKEEHYRRLAYSNEHFADFRPGWKTDRGHIYIVNGPPDEIQHVTPSAKTGPVHPSQVWKYEVGKEFRFVDECDCGRYELVHQH